MDPGASNIDDMEISLQRLKTGLEKTIQVFRIYENNDQEHSDGDQSTTSKHPKETRKRCYLCSTKPDLDDDEEENYLDSAGNSSPKFSESSSSDRNDEPVKKSKRKKLLWRNERRRRLADELSLAGSSSDIHIKSQVSRQKDKGVTAAFEEKRPDANKEDFPSSNLREDTPKRREIKRPSFSKIDASDNSTERPVTIEKFDDVDKRRTAEERRPKYSLPSPLPPYYINDRYNKDNYEYCDKKNCPKNYETTDKNFKPLKAKEKSLIPVPISGRSGNRSHARNLNEEQRMLPKTESMSLRLNQRGNRCLPKFAGRNTQGLSNEQTLNDQYSDVSFKQRKFSCKKQRPYAKSNLDKESRVNQQVSDKSTRRGPVNSHKQASPIEEDNRKQVSTKNTCKQIVSRKKPSKRRVRIQQVDPKDYNTALPRRDQTANQPNIPINRQSNKKENKGINSVNPPARVDSPTTSIQTYQQRQFRQGQSCGRVWLFGREKGYNRWKPAEDEEVAKPKRRCLNRNNSPGSFWRFHQKGGAGSDSKPSCPCPCCDAKACGCQSKSWEHCQYYTTQNVGNQTRPSNKNIFDQRQDKQEGRASSKNTFDQRQETRPPSKNISDQNQAETGLPNGKTKRVNQLQHNPKKEMLESKNVQTKILATNDNGDRRPQGDGSENVFVQYRPFATELQNVQPKKVNRPYAYFNDGKRRVDYVLVYSNESNISDGLMKLNNYLSNLESNGLELEGVLSNDFSGITYVKVHAPLNTVVNLAKVHNIELTFQRSLHLKEETALFPCMNTILTKPNPVRKTYKRNPETVSGAQPTEPTNAERIVLVYQVLKDAKFGSDPREYGIRELSKKGILETSYPLHDSTHQWTKRGPLSDRQLLHAYWTSTLSCCRKQPIQVIYKYFGPEVAFYYAWLSVYDSLLLPAVVFGVMALMYGLFTLDKNQNLMVGEVCAAKATICPPCSNSDLCGFRLLRDSCTYSKMNYVFDNHITVLFAICMSFWAIILLMLWKRHENLLKIGWGLYYLKENDAARQNYNKRTSVLHLSPNPRKDLSLSTSQKRIMWLLSGATLLFVVILITLVVLGIGFYRVAAMSFLSSRAGSEQNVPVQSNAGIKTAITASLLSALFIIIFSSFCSRFSNWLTKLENPRTQAEYDRSYAIKLFVLEFVNNYAVAFYLAFFRGALYTYPGGNVSWKILFGVNADICDPSGCVADLAIHIIIIMVAKALVIIFKHGLIPTALRYLTVAEKHRNSVQLPQWELDYVLFPSNYQCITKFCAESMVQFGFLVFFVAAFPLMPLLAFFVNEIQIRTTANKLVRFLQRPVPKLIPGLLVWNKILQVMVYMSIIINVLVIAFTTDFISKRLYASETSNSNLYGYINYTLSEFSIKHFNLSRQSEMETCYYKGKQYLADDEKLQYKYRPDFFQEMIGKLVFVIVTIILLVIFASLIFCMIPYIPHSVQKELQNQKKKHEKNYQDV